MITIITSSFNSQKTIKKTIKSILDQSEGNFEYIIIDGGSNDNTIEIIKSYESDFKKKKIPFRWISENDKGIYDAWNKGVKLSIGQWISFIGTDDILIKDYIKIYSNYINNQPYLDYISSVVHVIKNNKVIKIIDKAWNWNVFKRYMNVGHVGSLHNKNLYDKYGYYDVHLKIAGDYEFLLRVKHNLKAGFINKLTVKMGANGISNNDLISVLNETKKVKIKHHTVNKLQSNFDFIIAYLKGLLRKGIK